MKSLRIFKKIVIMDIKKKNNIEKINSLVVSRVLLADFRIQNMVWTYDGWR